MAVRWGAPLLIAAVGVLFFADLGLHPADTLYSDYSDLITLHLPAKHFLLRSWQETGEVPLWCPYNFAGMPFVHDVQSSAFYPLHFPLYFLPEQYLGAALSWLIVLHVIAAGLCMYAYARHRGLERLGALVAAIGYMFAGKWLLHLLGGGHYNMVPLAWLPLVLLCLERAVERGSLLYATAAGGAYALIVLGAYPYVTLYAGIFAGVWTWRREKAKGIEGGIICWVCMGLWVGLVGMGLGALQLLPSIEAAREASRATGVEVSAQFVLEGMRSLIGLVGPPLAADPNSLENRAAMGVLWFALVLAAPSVGGSRARFEFLVWAGLLVFAFGGAVLVQWLPGFRLFRLPSRMLLVAALPAAMLAGRTAQALMNDSLDSKGLREHFSRLLWKVALAVALMAGAYSVALKLSHPDARLQFHPYWITLLATVPATLWLLHQRQSGFRVSLWVAVLLADVWGLSRPLVRVRPEDEVYAPSASVRYLASRRDERGRVLDCNPAAESANATPLWPGLPAVQRIEPVRGFNPLDVLRYKEFLQFIADEDDDLHALDHMYTAPVVGTFPIKNQNLAELLGIRFLLQPAGLPIETMVSAGQPNSAWTRVAEDSTPTTYNFIPQTPNGDDCGLQRLPPYAVYEDRHVLPRAFVVSEAAPLPDRADVLAALRANDFRKRVFLEGLETGQGSDEVAVSNNEELFRGVQIREYLPNRVTLQVSQASGGYLVLNDIWFPGWSCHIDGAEVPIYRANYVFRAVELPVGAREVVFTFAPASYRMGRVISAWMALTIVVFCLGTLMRRQLSKSASSTREMEQDADFS